MDHFTSPSNMRAPLTKTKHLVILGGKGVGKTTIFNQLQGYYSTRHAEKINDANQIVVKTDRVHMTVSDINLPATLDDACLHTIPKGDAYVLVFDLADTQSFDYVEKIKDYLLESRGRRYPIMFVGNKRDVPKRALRYELIDCLVSIEWEMKYLEISATKEDAVPELLEAAFPKKKQVEFVPTDLDTFEFRGIKIRPRAQTESSLSKPKSKVDQDRIASLVSRGILPEPDRSRRFRHSLSLQNLPFLKPLTKRANKVIEEKSEAVHIPKKSNLISRLFECVKDNESTYRQ